MKNINLSQSKSVKILYYQKKLNEKADIFDIAFTSIKACCELIEAPKGTILLADSKNKYMEVKGIYNLSVKAKDFKWEINKFPDYYFADYVIIEDALNDITTDKEYIQKFNIKSGLIFSLKVDNEIIGSIQAYNKNSYDMADIDILRLFSPYIINCFIKNRSLIGK
jgi:hypothetical protein